MPNSATRIATRRSKHWLARLPLPIRPHCSSAWPSSVANGRPSCFAVSGHGREIDRRPARAGVTRRRGARLPFRNPTLGATVEAHNASLARPRRLASDCHCFLLRRRHGSQHCHAAAGIARRTARSIRPGRPIRRATREIARATANVSPRCDAASGSFVGCGRDRSRTGTCSQIRHGARCRLARYTLIRGGVCNGCPINALDFGPQPSERGGNTRGLRGIQRRNATEQETAQNAARRQHADAACDVRWASVSKLETSPRSNAMGGSLRGSDGQTALVQTIPCDNGNGAALAATWRNGTPLARDRGGPPHWPDARTIRRSSARSASSILRLPSANSALAAELADSAPRMTPSKAKKTSPSSS